MNSIFANALGRWIKGIACPVLVVALASCGGSGNSGGSAVNTLSASNIAYGRTMTVTVSGSKLDDPGLQMTVDGPCDTITRSAGATDFQAVFTCTVTGVGPISPRIRNADGLELARLSTTVPLPQVTMSIKQTTGATGTVVVELDPAASPITVKNFMFYVNSSFYTSTIIHRVVANQLIQGGGFTTGPTLKNATAAAIVLESDNGLKNLRGTIAMARTDVANSATSQFYFNLADNPAFDRVSDTAPGYAVFGKVLSGQDVLDQIGAVQVSAFSPSFPSFPTNEITIVSMAQSK
jgi:cyclophilin family peptidyl-prolyl cis-trans isomerase